MSMVAVSIVSIIIWVVCLVVNIWIAKKRNKSIVKWVVLSIFFSWIALIINACCKGPNGER